MCTNQPKKVILPLQKTFLSTFPGFSYLSSIILNKESSLDWLLNNLVQVKGYGGDMFYWGFIPNGTPSTKLDVLNAWDLCPFIDKYTYSRHRILKNYDSFISFVINSLNDGFYVYVYLDQFFRTDLGVKNIFAHANLIYGYDLDKQLVYLADHFDQGKYSFLQIEFNKIEEAYKIVNDHHSEKFAADIYYSKRLMDDILLFQSKDYKYDFDINLTLDLLKEYLYSNNNYNCIYRLMPYSGSIFKEYYFGIDIYSLLNKYIKKLLVKDSKIERDKKMFTMLLDHKMTMKLIVNYLQENQFITRTEYITNSINSLVSDSEIVVRLYLKYMITSDERNLHKILNIINRMKKCEKTFLEKLIRMIEINFL